MIKILEKKWGIFVGGNLWRVFNTEEEAAERSRFIMSMEKITWQPVSVSYALHESEVEKINI